LHYVGSIALFLLLSLLMLELLQIPCRTLNDKLAIYGLRRKLECM
jgi:hypothetical protein